MTRFAIAAIVVAVAALRGDAQPVPSAPPGPGKARPVPTAPPGPGAVQPVPLAPTGPAAIPSRGPFVIPVTSAKPPEGYYKSGGVLVGADGYYPFDTGAYLLGGFDGLTRYSGTFVMVPGAIAHPPVAAAPVAPVMVEPIPAAPASGHRRGLFHRR